MASPRRFYSPTGKPGDESSARHSREIGRFAARVHKELATVQAAAEAAQAAADAAAGSYPTLLDSVGALAISNTASRATLYSFTIPAGTVAAGHMLRLTLDAVIFQNTGVNRALILDVILGGVTLYESVSTSVLNSTIYKPVGQTVRIYHTSDGLASMLSTWRVGNVAVPTVGLGVLTSSPLNDAEISSEPTVAVDFDADTTLEVGVTLSAADANYSYTRYGATLELL